MIAVLLYEKLLKKQEAEAGLSEIAEKIGYYTAYEELLKDREEIEILISTGRPEEGAIAKMPNLKWIFSYSAGVNAYPLELLKQRGILLSNTSGIHRTNMAEQVLGGMILFSRNLLEAMANKTKKVWRSYPLDELTGRELLVIGTGRIGTEIARKARAFDMKVTGIRFRADQPKPPYFDEVYPVSRLDEVLAGKHYVCLIVPQTKETIRLMGKAQFDRMDKGSVFINVGRGETVDEAELIGALRDKKIRGAVLDVFENEPLPAGSPLWEMPNVVITPHNAGPTPHYANRALSLFCESLACYRRGEPLPTLVDLDRSY